MSKDFVLAIDQGTSNTKAIVIDREGKIVAKASVPMEIAFPQPGWVEQDPLAIWKAVETVIEGCLSQVSPTAVAAIGISNQRETVLAWDRSTGQPLGPAVIWQCRRTADFCQHLREQGLEPLLRERTGLTIDPLFSASKARWLLKQMEATGRQTDTVCLGTVDSWLLWNLTAGGVHATDFSNAARTQLFNLRTAAWDDELLGLFEIPASALPQILPSSGIFAETAALGNLGAGIPIASMIGDSHAALFGQRGFLPGSIKATYGTGSSLMTPIQTLRISDRGLSSTVAWGMKKITYALEGNISVTGSAVQWFGQFLGAEEAAPRVAALAQEVNDTAGVYLVPAFVGLGAPYWDEAARGMICGMTRGTTAAHVARAVIESIAYQVRDVFDAMQEDADVTLNSLLADGGATRNDQLMQFQADILNCAVLRNASPEVSPLGAAFLAGLATGFWSKLDDVAALPRQFDRFEPQMPDSQRAHLYSGWQSAVKRARS
ncbi:MAG TPA: glycerol kinase GlpK [Terrimicrobiaceae bacterium]|nr:glycerol kinase GlpK [Terrimicrobiaceae bacterium]